MTIHEFAFTPPRPLTTRIRPMLLAFCGYLAVALLGLEFASIDGVTTPVWGLTGIGLAVLVLGDRKLWPAIAAASLVAYLLHGATIPLAASLAIANTLALFAGAWVLDRVLFAPALDRMREIGALAAAGALVASISAPLSVAALWATGEVPASELVTLASLWWTSDLTSICVVAAVAFAVASGIRDGQRPTRRRAIEFAATFVLLAAVMVFVFNEETRRLPGLIVPFLAYATFRFRALGATLGTLMMVSFAQLAAIQGKVVVFGGSLMHDVQAMQLAPTLVGMSLLVLATALTERDAARAAAERAYQDEHLIAQHLREVDEMKDNLLAAVAHELRTPLTPILALSSLLHDGAADMERAKIGEMSGKLELEARRLHLLLTDLLDLERVRMGMLQPRYERVDLDSLMRESVDRSIRNPREMRFDLDAITIDGDASKLERIVDNLVCNADKHTPLSGQIAVSARKVDGGVVIAVDDEGLGVPDELKHSVFEPFNRGSVDHSEVSGSGIGLSLVAHFAALHGGSAWVEDRPEGGSSFRVFLPGEQAVLA